MKTCSVNQTVSSRKTCSVNQTVSSRKTRSVYPGSNSKITQVVEHQPNNALKQAIDGILILDKPVGMSSNQALQRVKRIFNARKAGHTGSLDPLASGVLPICFGKATKIAGSLLDADKKYLVTAKFGVTTTTGDVEGEIVARAEQADRATRASQVGQAAQVLRAVPELSAELCAELFAKFSGKIQQTPPMYSALKHNGVPLYKLARRGISVERASRTVEIKQLKLLAIEVDTITFEVHCSKGTYVRTLVVDMGEYLQCGAHVTQLRRIQAGIYDLEQAVNLQQLQAASLQDPQQLSSLLIIL